MLETGWKSEVGKETAVMFPNVRQATLETFKLKVRLKSQTSNTLRSCFETEKLESF